MKERGIIFNTEMVRAILEGRKTQTRRPIKPQPVIKIVAGQKLIMHEKVAGQFGEDVFASCMSQLLKSPYGEIGDRLYVRETWAIAKCRDDVKIKNMPDYADPYYLATQVPDIHIGKTRPSIYMPRRFSRITLEITDIRVERVQDINDLDSLSEGIGWDDACPEGCDNGYYPGAFERPVEAFEFLWDSINEKRGYGWDVNPWVWVVEFKRIEKWD